MSVPLLAIAAVCPRSIQPRTSAERLHISHCQTMKLGDCPPLKNGGGKGDMRAQASRGGHPRQAHGGGGGLLTI